MGVKMVRESRPIKTAILGSGNMGTALAHILASQGHRVSVWDFHPEVLHEIKHHQRNTRFLPGVDLHPGIGVSSSPMELVGDAQLVVVCVPSIFAGPLLASLVPVLRDDAIILNVAKGFAPQSDEPLPIELLKLAPGHRCVHLAGPAIANDFSRGGRTYVVSASTSPDASQLVSKWIAGPVFSVTTTTDLMGAALGGVLKNIYAILLGAVSVAIPELSANQQAAIVTASVSEMAALAIALGGKEATLYGLAGLGDLLATAYSPDSHNRKVGILLGEGRDLQAIEETMGSLPEGVKASHTALKIAHSAGISLPLAGSVAKLITGSPLIPGELFLAIDQTGKL